MRSNRAFFLSGATLAIACLLISCKPAPIIAELPKVSAVELAESIIGRAQSFSAKGVVRFDGGLLAFAEAEFLCDPKHGLRIDFFTPFMTPVAILTMSENQAQFLSIGENLLIRGKPKDLAGRIFHLNLDPAGLPWLLAGGLPPNLKGWRYEIPEKNNPGIIILAAEDSAGNSFHVVLQDKDYRVIELAVYGPDADDPLQVIECDNHLNDTVPIPRHLVLSSQSFEKAIHITLNEIKIGKGPSAKEMILDNMPGVRIEDL